jgi:flagella basal body P-ring formation protein FlgA
LIVLHAAVLAVLVASPPTSQWIAGARFDALADPIAHAVRLDGDAALVPSAHVPDQLVPAGSVTLAVGSALTSPAYINVPIEVDVNGKFLRNVYVGYRVQRYVRTAVATHDLIPGSVLTANDVEMERVPYVGQQQNGTSALIGRKVVTAIRKGAPVYIESTQTNQIVRAGNAVVLIVDDNGVTVAASAIARTSGGLGDEVSVYNPETNKLLSGTVVGPERVELDLEGGVQ